MRGDLMKLALLLLSVSLACGAPAAAQAPGAPPIAVSVDLRGRFESDVDSTRVLSCRAISRSVPASERGAGCPV